MKYVTKILTLYKDLCFSQNKHESTDESEYLWKYHCGVKHNDTNPKRDLFLLDGQSMGFSIKPKEGMSVPECTCIPQGKYLFLQGLIENVHANNHSLLLKASEELYLESLWLEKTIVNDIVFIRFLAEDGKNVFQIFREIENI